MSDCFYFERGPLIYTVDPIHQEKYPVMKNFEWSMLPDVCSFSEYMCWNYHEDYERMIRMGIETNQLPLGDRTEYLRDEIKSVRIEYIQHHKTYIHGIDECTFRIDTIIIAYFTAVFPNGQTVSDSQQYDIIGTFRPGKECDFFEKIIVYNYKDIPVMNPYDDNLVPIMKKCDLDAAAEKMLAKYYPEALNQPMRVRAVVLAKRMGFKVQNARLSEDDSKLGSIYFDDTEVTFFVNGEKMTGTAKSGTILIDVQAHKNRNITTDETIIHECIHAYLHRVFYFVQSSYHAFLSEALESFDDIEVDNSSSGVLKWIENQAVHMVFRVRMPLKHTSLMAAKLFMKYRDISDKEALENVIRELSDFFGVSRTAASVRLTEIGYDIERGVGQYANGMPVPGYIVGKEIHNDKTYTVDFRDIVEEYQRNEDFRKVIDNGGYVYAEGHLCRNKPEYIDILPTGISLTPYARTHMSECCLLFKNRKVKKKEKFDYRKLDRVIETNEITNLYQHDGKDIITEASDAAQIMTHLPNSFAETLIFHMKNLGISIRQLADVSCVSARTITRMRTINAPSPTLESIVAVSIGMKLFPELSFDMVKKAEKEFDYTNPVHFWYMVVLRTMYCDGIIRCNDMLRKNGIPPLGTK